MPYSRNYQFVAVLLMALVSLSSAAKSGKVRYAIGEPENKVILHENGKSEEARIGSKVREKDKIRTGMESQVIVALPDGSTISVEENSLVEFTNLNSDNGVQTAMTDVKQGKVRFDAQKQYGNSTFQFKTGTATAAIRGTDGSIGLSKKRRGVFGLNSGHADVEDQCGAKGSLSAGEILMFDGQCGFKKFKSSHSGDKKFMDQLLELADVDSLSEEKLQQQIDIITTTIEKAIENKKNSIVCNASGVADTVTTSHLTINVSCNGVPQKLYINGDQIQSPASTSYTASWIESSLGAKRFDFTCKDVVDVVELLKNQIEALNQDKANKDQSTNLNNLLKAVPEALKKTEFEFNCGSVETYYYNAAIDSSNKASLDSINNAIKQDGDKSLEISVNSDDICNKGAATVNGTITGKATKIDFTIGKQTEILSLNETQSSFTYGLTVNDQKKNWNATDLQATVTFSDGSTLSKKIPLAINKSCKPINTIKPIVVINNTNSNKRIAPCTATFSIQNNTDDEGLASLFIDQEIIKEFVLKGNASEKFNVKSGTHKYKVEFKDQAENAAHAEKSLTCLDANNNAKLLIDGKSTPSTERLRVPPPPQKHNNTIYRTLRFEISNLKNNDFSQIESISMTQTGVSGNLLYLSNANKGIDQLIFTESVALERNKTTTIKIKVKLYNGLILENSKTYEVR